MSAEIKDQLMKLQKEFVGDVLTLAELGLSKDQFRQFKKKVRKEFFELII